MEKEIEERKTKRSLEDVLEAIRGSHGIKTVIAAKLRVSRPTVNGYLQRWTTARVAYEGEAKTILDLAESIIVTNLKLQSEEQKENNQVDTSDARWVLRMKDDSYSPKDRREITGKDGKPIEHKIIRVVEYKDEQ